MFTFVFFRKMAVKYSDEPKYDWVSLSKKKKKETEQSVLLVHYS